MIKGKYQIERKKYYRSDNRQIKMKIQDRVCRFNS